MNRRKVLTGAGAALFGVTLAASAAPPSDRLAARSAQMPAGIEQLRLPQPLSMETAGIAAVDPALADATGRQEVIVRLRSPSVAKARGKSPAARIGHKETLKNEQSAFVRRASKSTKSMKNVASVQTVLNAVFLEVDAKDIPKLAADRDVLSINRVKNYEMDLSETVPYIGASAVQNAGLDGTGVRVAVLDSGVDYYHADLGGSGDPADYAADDPTVIEPGTFPTAKVVGGYDFLGNQWPDGPVLPDPDPLDDLALKPDSFAGHGTHVADIIGGAKGVAPGASIFAVKVCASLSSACSGIALINGMEFAVDPNGDGDPSDAVDIINMSLGASYGQPFDDDLSQAVENATALGVLTVSSAGNGSDKPYVTGTPSSAPSAISVAQTQVPSASLSQLTLNEVDYPAVFQAWSVPPTGVVSGSLQYGDGAGGNLNGCAPFTTGSLTDLVVLVDRGACNFTLKISNISQAGGAVGIIGLVAPGAPFSGGDGGDRPIDIPGYMISQADSNAFKAQVGAVVTVDPGNGLPIAGQMVGSSSRGPQHEDTTLIKPEIGAPGASVSAIAGTGTGTGPFGGTSGASPMVAGAAAQLLQKYPDRSPAEIKALLVNNGFTGVETDPFAGLAPITRIGGGEVRVDWAAAAPAAAWDPDTLLPTLSFGFLDADKETITLQKKLFVRNYSDETVRYSASSSFRFEEDAGGAVAVSVSPKQVRIKAGGSATVNVKMTINGLMLPGNFMNSGSQGADPAALTANEFDGYVTLSSDGHEINVPWHVLPRKAANVVGRKVLNFEGGTDVVELTNNGVGTAQNDAYSLLAMDPDMPEGGAGEQSPMPDLRAVGINTIPVPAGFCSGQDSFLWIFAANTWERQQHLMPVTIAFNLDTDRDGVDDYQVLNRDFSGPFTLSDGRHVTWVLNLATGGLSAFFFAEHSTNTGNTVLTICAEQVGLTGTDLLTTSVDMSVEAQDWYYGGPGDLIEGLTVTPLGEQYVGIPEDIPAGEVRSMEVIDFGALPGNSPELGIMLITNGDRGFGNRGGATESTEALLLTTDRPPAERRGRGGFGKK